MKLTEHFSLEELSFSETAVRLGIDNTPPFAVLPNLGLLATGLEAARAVIGHPMFVTSGYRCEALERVLCWKDFLAWCRRHDRDPETSWDDYFLRKAHPRGVAADFISPAAGKPAYIVRLLQSSKLRFDQIILEGTWVHISFDKRLRGEVLTATFANGAPHYETGVS